MKFEMNHKVGTDYSTVKFAYGATFSALETIWKTMEKLGGQPGEYLDEWKFPKHVTSQVIEEVIQNTCFVCGGLMKDSTAFKNQDFIEIPNGLSMTSHVYSNAGEAKQIKVRKCTSCGHSHT